MPKKESIRRPGESSGASGTSPFSLAVWNMAGGIQSLCAGLALAVMRFAAAAREREWYRVDVNGGAGGLMLTPAAESMVIETGANLPDDCRVNFISGIHSAGASCFLRFATAAHSRIFQIK